MEFLPPLLTLAGLHILMAMIPGPNTVLVSHVSAAMSRRAGLVAAAGVVVASLIWVALALAGIGVLLLEAGALYRALRLLGAAYLLYIGLKLLRAALRPASAAPAAPAMPPMGRLARRPFLAGLLTTLSNPKSAVFWTSVFAVAVPHDAPGWFLPAVLGVITVQSALWYGAIALLLSTGAARRSYGAMARWLDGIAGVAMLALGIRLGEDVRRELMLRATP